MPHSPILVLTPGEPAGIGPDLTVQLAQAEQKAVIVAIADPELLQQRAGDQNMKLHKYRKSLHNKFTRYSNWRKKRYQKRKPSFDMAAKHSGNTEVRDRKSESRGRRSEVRKD